MNAKRKMWRNNSFYQSNESSRKCKTNHLAIAIEKRLENATYQNTAPLHLATHTTLLIPQVQIHPFDCTLHSTRTQLGETDGRQQQQAEIREQQTQKQERFAFNPKGFPSETLLAFPMHVVIRPSISPRLPSREDRETNQTPSCRPPMIQREQRERSFTMQTRFPPLRFPSSIHLCISKQSP